MRLCILALSLILASCGDSVEKPSSQAAYQPTLPLPIPFILPAGVKTLAAPNNPSWYFGGSVNVSLYKRPNAWVIYLASINWTAGNKNNAAYRTAIDIQQLRTLKQFTKLNGLEDRVKVVWLQYDRHPSMYVLTDKNSRGNRGWHFLPKILSLAATTDIYDYYVVSPASRFSGEATLSYPAWIKPMINYSNDPTGKVEARLDHEQGIDDPKSEYWNRWGRHIFVVNPDGKLVDAYLSIGNQNRYSWPDQAMRSIAHNMNLSPEKVIYPKVNKAGVYDVVYGTTPEDDFVSAMKEFEEGLSDQ